MRVLIAALALLLAGCTDATEPAWDFDPSVPVSASHTFKVAPLWTVEPSFKDSFSPLEVGTGKNKLLPSAVTVTIGRDFY